MEAIRFKTRIEKGRVIRVPDSVILPEADADVIVLIEKKITDKDSDRWERWIKKSILSGGIIEPWKREEIYDR